MEKNTDLRDLFDILIQRAQDYERKAQQLYAAAKLLNPQFEETSNHLIVEKIESEIPAVKKTRREQVIEALKGKQGLARHQLRALLPDMPPGTLAFLLSHDKKSFVVVEGKWYVRGEEPQ